MAANVTAELRSYLYIENTLLDLCDASAASSPFLQGGSFIQPGFTLLFTVGMLLFFSSYRRLSDLADAIFPTSLADKANNLIVSSSILPYNEQAALIRRLHDDVPSIRGVFPEDDLLAASFAIAKRQMDGSVIMRAYDACFAADAPEQCVVDGGTSKEGPAADLESGVPIEETDRAEDHKKSSRLFRRCLEVQFVTTVSVRSQKK